jgi:hypothetical protein
MPILVPDGSAVKPTGEYTPLQPDKVLPINTQVHHTVSGFLRHISCTRLWTVHCVRSNDSGSPGSFDKRRVRAQLKLLGLADLVQRKEQDYVVEYKIGEMLDRYVPTMQGREEERLTQCVSANGWMEGKDYAMGSGSVWLSYWVWKVAEDGVRQTEKAQKSGDGDDDADDGATEYSAVKRERDQYSTFGMDASGHLANPFLSQFSCATVTTVTPVTTGSSPSDSPNQSGHFEPLCHTKRPHTPMDLCGHTSA